MGKKWIKNCDAIPCYDKKLVLVGFIVHIYNDGLEKNTRFDEK